MSLSLPLQLKVYELLACKRMSGAERAEAQQRFVSAWSDGAVRVLIRELEAFEDMTPDEVEDRWRDIEAEMDAILPYLE